MENLKKAVILVGHGGLPRDIPSETVEKFMRVHKSRLKAGGPITEQEVELDTTIRKWQRTPENDSYKTGLETLASHMEPMLKGFILRTAYNEFCYPAIEDAVEELAKEKVSQIFIVTTMITRGGSHSENEIPEEVRALSSKYLEIDIQYAWPFSMDAFALFLTDHIKNYKPIPELSADLG
jgi:sirohydrochlorin cobaltochelatase